MTELGALLDDLRLVGVGGAGLVGAVTDTQAEVHVLAEALDIGGGGTSQAGGQTQHVVDASFLALISVLCVSQSLSSNWGIAEAYTAVWELVDGIQVLGNGEAGAERGDNGEAMHRW